MILGNLTMVEHHNSLKIEFILQRIEEIFLKNFPAEQVFQELLHYELIYWTYRQQKYSSFEFINLQFAFENLVFDLYNCLQFNDRQKINQDCLTIFFNHCQKIEITFSPKDINTIQNILNKYSCTRKNKIFIQKISELYTLWRQQQEQLKENKLLLPENNTNKDLEIDRLIAAEIKHQKEMLWQTENQLIEVLNNLYAIVSPLHKIFPTYCKRNVFLQISEEAKKSNEYYFFSRILQHKYLKKTANLQWSMTDCDQELLLELKGGFIYEELYPEIGIHQIQKEQHLLESINVDIIPQPSLTEIPEIDYQDLRIKTITLNPGYGVEFYSFEILHKPTKITATICGRYFPMYLAMRLIVAKIYSNSFKQKQKTIIENLLPKDFSNFENNKYNLNIEKTYYCRRYHQKF